MFAEAGINALVFDYRNLGVSDGDNRRHLDSWAQIRDYQTARPCSRDRSLLSDF